MSTPCVNCGYITSNDLPIPPIPPPNPLALTNCPPSGSDIEEARTFVTIANGRLDVLNQQVSALASVLAAVTQERDKLLADVRSHIAIVSPLRRLPSELICRIFSMTIPPLRRLETQQAPWYLGHICQRWRDIAVRLPMLWSSFVIPKGGKSTADDSEASETQFSRTGQAPLQIAIIYPVPWIHLRSPLHASLLAACHRWDVLVVKNEEYFADMARELHGKLSALRHFSADRISQKSVEILETCQSLREIEGEQDGLPPSAHVPWHIVTHYSGTVRQDQYLHIFRKTLNLVECRLKVNGDFSEVSKDITVLPSLRRLYLHGTSCLVRITAPRLEELALNGLVADCDPAHVLSFIERSACTIERLSLFLNKSDMSPWLPILQKLPSIQELTVASTNEAGVGLLFEEAMAHKDDDPQPLLPNLIAFSVGDLVLKTMRIRSFLKILAARASHSCPLESFGLIMNLNTDPARIRLLPSSSSCIALQKLRDAGLHIRLINSLDTFHSALETDPFSIQRCSMYDGIATLELFE
ncbi:hypothetical protein B0H11DRAFT_1976328 [Mycena galericulata]|nr:hypothetical protein B0H11DRAFT_1976328 [Mycena galericulata]